MRAVVIGIALAMATPVGAAELAYVEAEKLSTEDKLSRAKDEIGKMKAALKETIERRSEAKKRADLLQINCINDQLQSINGMLKIAEGAEGTMRGPEAQNNDEQMNHLSTKISIALKQVGNFRKEVEACVGEASLHTGQTIVDLTVDPNILSGDPTEEPGDPVFPPVALDRPDPVSGSE